MTSKPIKIAATVVVALAAGAGIYTFTRPAATATPGAPAPGSPAAAPQAAAGTAAVVIAVRAVGYGHPALAVAANAADWADVASTSKLLPADDPLRGEEWLSGPYGTLTALAAYAESLRALDAGKSPAGDLSITRAPGGRVRAPERAAL